MEKDQVLCSYCARTTCFKGDLSRVPDFCPSVTRRETADDAKTQLAEPDNRRMAQAVARTWKDYGRLTRVEETVLYARLQGFKKLGLAFCVGGDTLFIKHSKAPVPVLAVKDRVLAHKPLGALYTARNMYPRLKTRRARKAEEQSA